MGPTPGVYPEGWMAFALSAWECVKTRIHDVVLALPTGRHDQSYETARLNGCAPSLFVEQRGWRIPFLYSLCGNLNICEVIQLPKALILWC